MEWGELSKDLFYFIAAGFIGLLSFQLKTFIDKFDELTKSVDALNHTIIKVVEGQGFQDRHLEDLETRIRKIEGR